MAQLDPTVADQGTVTLPWLLLACLAVPFLFAVFRGRVYPSLRLTGLAVVLAFSALFVLVQPSAIKLILLADAFAALLLGLDATLLWIGSGGKLCRGIRVQRELPSTASIHVPIQSVVTISNLTQLHLRGHIRDDLPETFQAEPEEHPLDLEPNGEIACERTLVPRRRGGFEFSRTDLQILSPLRFWKRYLTVPVHGAVSVYPDMKQLADYALLARTNRLSLIGVRRTRRVGQDSEFERLRDYSRDDNYRHIDWRSTARRNKLTVRQFQNDQSQRVIFMLDCGRMMTNTRDGLSLFDHALNACLMMAFVALKQGDAVGMICFSDKVHAYIPPRGGGSHMNRLLQAGFNQFPRMVESRYDQAFLHLSMRCKRRSLVCLTTSLIDEVNAEVLVDYLGNLSGTHLPLGVLIRDHTMFDAADRPLAAAHAGNEIDEFTMYRAAAAADILVWRDEVLTEMRHRGVLVVDAFPDELTAPLVNQYLEIKAKHLL
ncbi:MAG: DUF58 domain-containing protein [Planctomycetota bacterium]